MPTQPTPQIVLTHYDWSLARLKEALEKENTEYYRGAALQRFGLTYGLALKTIRAFAEEQGKTCPDEESCFEWVQEQQWLAKDADWKKMLDAYRKTQKRPTGEEAEKIYAELWGYYELFKQIRDSMANNNDL